MGQRKIGVQVPDKALSGHRRGAVLFGGDASDLLTGRIIPNLQRAFDYKVASFSRLDTVTQLCLAVSEFLPKVGRGLRLPMPPRPRSVGISQAAYSYSARVALERATANDSFGADPINISQRDRLVRMAADWTQCMVLAEIASREKERSLSDPGHLGEVEISLQSGGIEATYSPAGFDALEHSATASARTLNEDPRDLLTVQGIEKWLTNGAPPDDEIGAISGAMKDDVGYSVLDVIGALKIGAYWSLDSEVSVAVLEKFREQISEVGDGTLAADEAFEHMTFPAPGYDLESYGPHKLRYEPVRLITSPFVVSGEMVYLIRDLLFESLSRHINYLISGKWPLSPSALKENMPTFHAALEKRKTDRGKGSFELLLEELLDSARLPNASLGAQKNYGSARSTREVDRVVLDRAASTIWVIEAKDIFSDGTLLGFRSTIDKFFGKKGFIAKLQESVDQVTVDPGAVADHVLRHYQIRNKLESRGDQAKSVSNDLRDSEREGGWQVRGAFVVRDSNPMEHVTQCPFPVVSPAALVSLMTR